MREKKEKIVLVDDSPDTLEVLKRNLERKGYKVITFLNANSAIKYLKKDNADIVITDYKMPGASGFDLLKFVNDNLKETETLMITGYPSIEGAVKAMKTGAEEYLSKPFTDEELYSAVERTINILNRKKLYNEKTKPEDNSIFNVSGKSLIMKKVLRLINKASLNDKPVFITGEFGTEISSVAHAIHYLSKRKLEPFITFSFSETPEKFVIKSLFGSKNSNNSILELSSNGTLYLENIEQASMDVQKKLLKIIKTNKFTSLNSNIQQKVNFRIIASSYSNIIEKIKRLEFKEALYVSLNQNSIEIPSLKQRGDDIIQYIHQMFQNFKKESGKSDIRLSERAIEVLKNYNYPGNLLELKYLMKSVIDNSDEKIIDAPDIPSLVRFSELPEPNFTRTLFEVEKHYIRGVLQLVKNNKSKAAKILDIDRKTIREKMR